MIPFLQSRNNGGKPPLAVLFPVVPLRLGPSSGKVSPEVSFYLSVDEYNKVVSAVLIPVIEEFLVDQIGRAHV